MVKSIAKDWDKMINSSLMRCHLFCLVSIALCILATATGCRRSDTISLTGQITLDGTALPTGNIVLIPMNKNSGPSVGCAIVEGCYSIPSDRGPLRGVKYRVEIRSIDPTSGSKSDPLSGGRYPVFRDRVPATFNSQSQLELAIPDDTTRLEKDFQLQGK